MFWKIVMNWRKIAKLVELVRASYADKNLTKSELEIITSEILTLLVDLGLVDKE